jgi:3-dehydroquinate dehydratase/shikimate dehydrogenase
LFKGSEDERRQILQQALELGAEYVDLEWKAGFDALISRFRSRVVISSHDFTGVPDDLTERARAMRQTGAAVIKLAVTARRLSDTLPLLPIGREGDAVVLGMGDAGVPSRLLAAHFGSRWSYAGQRVAPGQVPAGRMANEFRFHSVTRTTAVYGVAGNNVLHSLSPVMHNAAFTGAELDAVYVPLPAADVDDFQAFAAALGIQGASVTIPFKLDALRIAARADDRARMAGAANTLRRAGDEWEATNTDIDGFLEPLDSMHAGTLRGARVAVMGAGGAARAVVVGLMSRGAAITVYARRREQAEQCAREFGLKAGDWPPAAGSWDILVNTTPLGSASRPEESPLPGGPFEGRVVYDLTYGPQSSPLLVEARAAGCDVLDGLPMLVAQAERQFEWWTGRRPPGGVMREAAEQRIGGRLTTGNPLAR